MYENAEKCTFESSIEIWKKAIWSDESSFIIFSTIGRVPVWCTPRERCRPEHLTPAVRGSGGSLMLMGAFCLYCLGPLTHLEIGDTANQYKVLSDHLFPTMQHFYSDGRSLFQNDNTPLTPGHVGVTEWFDEHENDQMNGMLWPSHSPVTTLVEHLWEMLNWHIRQQYGVHSSSWLLDIWRLYAKVHWSCVLVQHLTNSLYVALSFVTLLM